MPAYIQTLIEHLQNHPIIGLQFAFAVAFIESLAVLGTIVPGSVTMTAVGVMVGSGILPVTTTFFVTILGAFIGDVLSYWFGWRYRAHIHDIWPFKKYRKLMELGEKFFKSHGGKSVVIGRFFGPVRSLVPLIAGVLQMRLWFFLLAALISASSWSIVYMLPGIFLGALSLELPAGKATRFLAYALIFILLAWTLIWALHYLFQTLWRYVDNWIAKCWHYLKRHAVLNYVPTLIENPRSPENHRQLTLFFLAVFTLTLFLLITFNIKSSGFFTELDKPIYYLLQSFQINWLTNVAVGITFLGDKYPLLLATFLIFITFIYRRSFWSGLHLALLAFASVILIQGVKLWVHATRPEIYQAIKGATSFPSGHVGFSSALFGFAAVLIATELTGKKRRLPYTIAFSLISLISLSRIYLGAHWLSDVVGSLFLGASLALFFTVSYRRKTDYAHSARFLITLIPLVFLSCCTFYGVARFKVEKQKYVPQIQTALISYQQWWQNKANLPLYRLNRFGLPIQPLNVQWVGDLSLIRNFLLTHNWQDNTGKNTIKNIILQELSEEENKGHLYLLPKLYHNQPPVLQMVQPIEQRWVLLELWDAHTEVSIQNKRYPLYLGVIYLPSPHKWLTRRQQDIYFNADELKAIFPKLGISLEKKAIKLPATLLPNRVQKLLPDKQWELIKVLSVK